MKTILVVDDEFGSTEALSLILSEEGYSVVCAANGRQGLERLAESNADLVIADLMMPLMNGDAMVHAIRADRGYDGVRIVMTSGLSEAAVRQRFDGFDAFLRKPFRVEVLLDTLRRLLTDE